MYKQFVRLRSAILVFLTHNIALPVLQVIRNEEKFPYTDEQLRQMRDGSLGKELINMLDERKLPLLSYYARHDIKHVLLDYDTTDEGEVCLQCFMLGNGHVSFPVLITVVFGFVAIPEHWSRFKQAYQRGRGATRINDWKWFELIQHPIRPLMHLIDHPVRTNAS